MKSLVAGGTELFYEDHGDGPPLLLVHGFPLDHSMWSGLMGKGNGSHLPERPEGRFAQKETDPFRHRIIAPDLRGFGRSPAAGETVAMERFADDLAGLLDALRIDEPVIFCGLSMGGYIALQFWRKHRQRLRGLVLCDTRAAADSPEAAEARGLMAERLLREGMEPMVETTLTRLVAESTRKGRPRLLEELRRVMAATDPRGAAAALRGMAQRPDMSDSLAEIDCPALLIVGREDAITPPAEMRAMSEAIRDAKYVEIPDAGHLSPLENPAAVAAALDEFVRSTAAADGRTASRPDPAA
ncbi:MAG: alpha/beta fold hydrolase [Pirellulales bacterium]|nr:alpha/beta fold hydrolase [Pirellulales bacterium]